MKHFGLMTLFVAILAAADTTSVFAQQGSHFQRVTTTASSGSLSPSARSPRSTPARDVRAHTLASRDSSAGASRVAELERCGRSPTCFTPTRVAPGPWTSRLIVDPMAAASPPGATSRSLPLPPPEPPPYRNLTTITPPCDPALTPRSRSSSRPTKAVFSPARAAPPAAPG